MPGGLPEVTQEWTADVSAYVEEMSKLIASTREAASAVEGLQRTIDELHGKTVDLGVDTAAASAAAAVNDLADAEYKLSAASQLQVDTSRMLADTDALLAAQAERLAAAYADAARNAALLAAAESVLADATADEMRAAMAAAAAQFEQNDAYRAFTALQSETVAAITEAAAAERIKTYADYQGVAASAAATQAAIERSAAENDVATSVARAAESIRNYSVADQVAAAEETKLAIELEQNAGMAGFLVTSLGRATTATNDVGAAANRAWRPWFLFGQTWQTALHWIIAGGAELLAVTVPAAVALGAGLLVASQGAQNAANHMRALWTATEATGPAFHTTTGDVLGLGHALQTAQDQANPGVYEILGSAINDARTRFADFAGTGLQVVHMLDEFSARITVDLQGAVGGQLRGLLAGMVPDLQEIGQVFGNLGHSVLNLAAAMPGLARVLLGVADGISRVALAVTSIPAGFITAGMAMEEFFRWGGLVLGMLARLAGAGGIMAAFGATNFITRFGAALAALVSQGGVFIAWIGNMVGKLGGIVPMAEEAGAALETMGTDMAVAGATASAGMVALYAGIAAGAVIAIVAISRIKDATDQWVAATNQAVAAASDLQVLGTIGKVLTENTMQLTSATQRYNTVAKETGTQSAYMTARFGAMNGEAQRAAQDIGDLTMQQQHLVGVATNVAENVGVLGREFHTSAAGALALANAAGVNLQLPLTHSADAMRIAEQQIRNLITGLGAMGAPAGVVGRDMEALGVQSQLAGTKVQQLNQAWDQFVTTLTSGMGAWASTRSAMQQMSAATFTLRGSSAAAAAGWTTFTGAINSGETSISFLRTGMAEGAVSVRTFETTVKGLVGEMLPFAAGNKAAVATLSALAQEAGGPATSNVKTLSEWAGVKGAAAAAAYEKGLEKATTAMSNMSAVAQHLSATISGQVDGALSSAILKTSGVSNATNTYVADLHKYGAQAPQTMAAQNALNQAMANAYRMSQQAAAGIGHTGSSAAAAGGQMRTAAGEASALAAAIASLHSKTVTVTTIVNTITNQSIIDHVTTQVGPHVQHGGIIPGYAPGQDTVHAMLSPGEGILNPYAVRMLGAGWVHAVNRIAESGGSVNPGSLRAGVSGPGFSGEGAVIHNHIILDGREIASSVRRADYSWSTRNSGVRSGLNIPGTRIG